MARAGARVQTDVDNKVARELRERRASVQSLMPAELSLLRHEAENDRQRARQRLSTRIFTAFRKGDQ